MSKSIHPLLQALRSAGWRWRDRLGTPGLVGGGVALAAALLAGIALQRTEALQAEETRLRAALRSAQAARAKPATPALSAAQSLLARLPLATQRPEDIATLMASVRAKGLSAARTQYRMLESRSPAIQRLEVTLDANQGYEAWRGLMVELLNQLPHAAISGASWSRSEVESEQTEARLSVVLYHRRLP